VSFVFVETATILALGCALLVSAAVGASQAERGRLRSPASRRRKSSAAPDGKGAEPVQSESMMSRRMRFGFREANRHQGARSYFDTNVMKRGRRDCSRAIADSTSSCDRLLSASVRSRPGSTWTLDKSKLPNLKHMARELRSRVTLPRIPITLMA